MCASSSCFQVIYFLTHSKSICVCFFSNSYMVIFLCLKKTSRIHNKKTVAKKKMENIYFFLHHSNVYNIPINQPFLNYTRCISFKFISIKCVRHHVNFLYRAHIVYVNVILHHFHSDVRIIALLSFTPTLSNFITNVNERNLFLKKKQKREKFSQ